LILVVDLIVLLSLLSHLQMFQRIIDMSCLF